MKNIFILIFVLISTNNYSQEFFFGNPHTHNPEIVEVKYIPSSNTMTYTSSKIIELTLTVPVSTISPLAGIITVLSTYKTKIYPITTNGEIGAEITDFTLIQFEIDVSRQFKAAESAEDPGTIYNITVTREESSEETGTDENKIVKFEYTNPIDPDDNTSTGNISTSFTETIDIRDISSFIAKITVSSGATLTEYDDSSFTNEESIQPTFDQVKYSVNFGLDAFSNSTATKYFKVTSLSGADKDYIITINSKDFIITEAEFDAIFPNREHRYGGPGPGASDFYGTRITADGNNPLTYINFIKASESKKNGNYIFSDFLTEGDDDEKRLELSALFGNLIQQTGGGDNGEYGLVYIEELRCDGYTDPWNPGDPEANEENCIDHYLGGADTYSSSTGNSFHGRGPIQISHPTNYRQFSNFYYEDENILIDDPDRVIKDGVISWSSAIWFWMTPQGLKPSCHDIMLNYDGDKFGKTIMVINGGLECGPTKELGYKEKVANRILYYKTISELLGLTPPQNAGQFCEKNTSANGDYEDDGTGSDLFCESPQWSQGGYEEDSKVYHNGAIWTAEWSIYTTDTPGEPTYYHAEHQANEGTGWKKTQACQNHDDPALYCDFPKWVLGNSQYEGDTKVYHNSKIWKSAFWADDDDEPGVGNGTINFNSAWKVTQSCEDVDGPRLYCGEARLWRGDIEFKRLDRAFHLKQVWIAKWNIPFLDVPGPGGTYVDGNGATQDSGWLYQQKCNIDEPIYGEDAAELHCGYPKWNADIDYGAAEGDQLRVYHNSQIWLRIGWASAGFEPGNHTAWQYFSDCTLENELGNWE